MREYKKKIPLKIKQAINTLNDNIWLTYNYIILGDNDKLFMQIIKLGAY